jgi:hypothetical protein
MEKITWTALEYEEKDRSQDWFWALGIIACTTAVTSIIYANYFFAALILISAALLAFFAIKKPDIITYELGSKGFKAGTRFYPFENIQAFWVETENKPKFFVKLDRPVMPNISVNIDINLADKISTIMLDAGVVEEQMQEHHAEKVMEFFGF